MVAEAITATVQAPNVTGAIRNAARATGASFEYLLATAQVESRLNPNARAQTSSARGLYQFIEQTWLETMKRAGATHGYTHYADAITRTNSGRYVVQDPALKGEILKLRGDPTANALMAGAFTNRNSELLTTRLGRAPTEGELYMAHFLGPSGAARLISLAGRNPDANAAASFRSAARANRSIFFDRQGHARGAADVTTVLTGRYNVARGGQAAPTALTQATNAIEPVQAPAAALPPPARVAAVRPVFPNLFSVSERRDPVAPFVKELWEPARAATRSVDVSPVSPAAPAVAPPAAEAAPGPPLDLFQQLKPNIRALFRGSA
jgi:hypothetical protein